MDCKKLYDALMTIQNTCRQIQKESSCVKCPMSNGNYEFPTCCIGDKPPYSWDVISPEVKVMR